MDYEVFLLSRTREELDATGDNTESVARGHRGHGAGDHLVPATMTLLGGRRR
jgi:uncharacterized membrane protein YdfJ with MMPL/SSD domain